MKTTKECKVEIDDRRARLIALMDDNNLAAKDVARILNRSVDRVHGWRSNHTIPDHMLMLLEFKVKTGEISH